MSHGTLLAGMLALSAAAQTRVDLKAQSANVDFRTAPYTKPMKSGASLPATCTQGDLFFITTAVPGANVYGCTATNTWTAQGSGGGQGALTVESNGTTVGTRSIANFVAGFGILNSILDSGTKFNIQQGVDSATVLTRTGSQSGQSLICSSSGGSGAAYTCAMNPTLTGYTGAMVVHWVPDVTVTGGGTTLNVDMLGARDVKLADGTSDPAATDIVGGRMYQMWYDAGLGKFRLQQGVDAAVALTRTGNQAGQTLLCASSGGSGAAYTCTMNPTLTGYTGAMVVHWVPGVTVAGGGTTLNVDMLGARDVKLADGTSDPAPTDVIGGRMYQMWYDAGLGKFRLQQGVDAAVALTRTGSQAGQALICGSSGGSGAAYTCTMNPTLTGYSGGMVVHWVPDVTSTGGGTTLNVDMLGAKDVKLADGTSDPTPTDIVGGRMYQMWYDAGLGKFRLQQGVDAAVALTRTGNQAGQTLLCASSGGSGAAYTCAMNPTLTGYSGGMVVHWVPDVTVADGGTNLNMDMLGAKDVKLADGTSDPSPTDIVGGRMYQIWYDAAIGKFRRVQ